MIRVVQDSVSINWEVQYLYIVVAYIEFTGMTVFLKHNSTAYKTSVYLIYKDSGTMLYTCKRHSCNR